MVGDSSHHRQFHQLALRASVYPAQRRLSALPRGRHCCSAGLLDLSRRTNLRVALVRHRIGGYRIGSGRQTDRTDGGTLVSFLAFAFIIISLVTFVAAQLILKRAMEFSTPNGVRNSYFLSRVAIGVALMTVSFFLTLGLLHSCGSRFKGKIECPPRHWRASDYRRDRARVDELGNCRASARLVLQASQQQWPEFFQSRQIYGARLFQI